MAPSKMTNYVDARQAYEDKFDELVVLEINMRYEARLLFDQFEFKESDYQGLVFQLYDYLDWYQRAFFSRPETLIIPGWAYKLMCEFGDKMDGLANPTFKNVMLVEGCG